MQGTAGAGFIGWLEIFSLGIQQLQTAGNLSLQPCSVCGSRGRLAGPRCVGRPRRLRLLRWPVSVARWSSLFYLDFFDARYHPKLRRERASAGARAAPRSISRMFGLPLRLRAHLTAPAATAGPPLAAPGAGRRGAWQSAAQRGARAWQRAS